MAHTNTVSHKLQIMHTSVLKLKYAYSRSQLQYSIITFAIKSRQLRYIKKLSNAVVQTKVINCNIANKSCLLQLVHTKAIAALAQFCNFYHYFYLWNINIPCETSSLLVKHSNNWNNVKHLFWDVIWITSQWCCDLFLPQWILF